MAGTSGDSTRPRTVVHLHEDEEACDLEALESLNRSFAEVQSVLDRNRLLIQQVNGNHQSRIYDDLVKNVSLIGEINDNISKVISIYSRLSADFLDIVRRRRSGKDGYNGEMMGKLDLNQPVADFE